MFHILSEKRNKGYRYWYFIGIDRHLMVNVCKPLWLRRFAHWNYWYIRYY